MFEPYGEQVNPPNSLIETVTEGAIDSSQFGLPNLTGGTDDPNEYTGASGKLATQVP